MGVGAPVRMMTVAVRDVDGVAMVRRDAVVSIIRRFAAIEPNVAAAFLGT